MPVSYIFISGVYETAGIFKVYSLDRDEIKRIDLKNVNVVLAKMSTCILLQMSIFII